MPTIYEGTFAPPPGRFALVAARFNHFVVEHLVGGALDGLKRHGVADESIDVIRVPGSFEIPLVAKKLAASGRYAALICLGAVIRGETGHYDHVAGEAAGGVARAALEAGIPDVGSMIFASLGIALALHGGRAVRARALNVACVGLSLGMTAVFLVVCLAVVWWIFKTGYRLKS